MSHLLNITMYLCLFQKRTQNDDRGEELNYTTAKWLSCVMLHEKTCTFCIDTGSACDLTVIYMSWRWLRHPALHVNTLKTEDKNITGEEWDWIDVMSWGLAMDSGRRCDDRKQSAGSRSEIKGKWGKKQNGSQWRGGMCSSVGMSFFEVWFSIIRHVFPILPVLKFIKVKCPTPFNSPKVLQTRLYLDNHQGLWHSISSTTLLTVISGEAVKLFIITRLSEMGEEHGCKALEWNFGRIWDERDSR